MNRTNAAVAAGLGAITLAFGAGIGASVADSPQSVAAVAVVEPPAACTAVDARGGQIGDPCGGLTATWEQSNRNALGTMAYYPKWKAASPNEYAMLRAWGTSPASSPEPTTKSAFGALVRYHLTVCRTWAVDLSRCLLP